MNSKNQRLLIKYIGLLYFFSPISCFAEVLDGKSLSLWWGLPFVGILLCIALGPLLIAKLWEAFYGRITLLWIMAFILPFVYYFGSLNLITLLGHVILQDYLPFILLLLALYTVSGGIYIQSELKGTPWLNTFILALGALCASVMGTTGASVLLIRPLLRANQQRKYQVHTVIFFIFIVANIGGGLTPLGDPPLFLGFLKGVDFLWVFEHMLFPVLLLVTCLLVIYFWMDVQICKREHPDCLEYLLKGQEKYRIYGKKNFILLFAIICVVLLSSLWQTKYQISVLDMQIKLNELLRDFGLLFITCLSLVMTPKQVRNANQFTWHAIQEVAKLFLGIFITITPVIAILRAGTAGSMKSIVLLVSNAHAEPINYMYFWLSGILSSCLDNAPTYLVFFNLASGDAQHLMSAMPKTLLAISMGSVFMGAVTYIGNAPNFMVKSIAQEYGIKMPNFFGYIKWSISILFPLFILLTALFLL